MSFEHDYWLRERRFTAFDASDGLVALRTASAPANLAQMLRGLVTALQDAQWQVRAVAACALGKLGDARTVGPLIAVSTDESAEVRSAAMYALGEIGTAPAIAALIAGLRDQDEDVHLDAVYSLGQHVVTASAALIAALRDEPAAVRVGAAAALAWGGTCELRGAADVLAALLTALRDEEALVRLGACWALGEVGTTQAVDPLIATLQDADAEGRAAAARALGPTGDARAVAPLVAASRDEAVREHATWALGKIGAAAIEALLAMIPTEAGEAGSASRTVSEPRPQARRKGWRRVGRVLTRAGAKLGATLCRLGQWPRL